MPQEQFLAKSSSSLSALKLVWGALTSELVGPFLLVYTMVVEYRFKSISASIKGFTFTTGTPLLGLDAPFIATPNGTEPRFKRSALSDTFKTELLNDEALDFLRLCNLVIELPFLLGTIGIFFLRRLVY